MGEKYYSEWRVTVNYTGDFCMGQETLNKILELFNKELSLKLVKAETEMRVNG